jgi:hypothetical protein
VRCLVTPREAQGTRPWVRRLARTPRSRRGRRRRGRTRVSGGLQASSEHDRPCFSGHRLVRFAQRPGCLLAWASPAPKKSAETQRNQLLDRVEAGGIGIPVRRLAPGYPRVPRRRQACGIPTMAIPARTRSDPRFPEDPERFRNVRRGHCIKAALDAHRVPRTRATSAHAASPVPRRADQPGVPAFAGPHSH